MTSINRYYDIDVVAYVMNQLSLKAALKMWGNDARLAAKAAVSYTHLTLPTKA